MKNKFNNLDLPPTQEMVKYFISFVFLLIAIILIITGISTKKRGPYFISGIFFILLFAASIFVFFVSFTEFTKNVTPAQLVFFIFLLVIAITFFFIKSLNLKQDPNPNDYLFIYPGDNEGNIDLNLNPIRLTTNGPNSKKEQFAFDGDEVGVVKGSELPVESPNEFTYSFWLNLKPKNFVKTRKKWRTVISRGLSDNLYTKKTPGVFLAPNTNQLIITVACENGPDEGNAIVIEDVPLGEWFCVTIVLEGRSLDCYINGLLERSIALTGDVLASKDNLIKGIDGGFLGRISFLRYSMVALSPEMIMKKYTIENQFVGRNLEIMSGVYINGVLQTCKI